MRSPTMRGKIPPMTEQNAGLYFDLLIIVLIETIHDLETLEKHARLGDHLISLYPAAWAAALADAGVDGDPRTVGALFALVDEDFTERLNNEAHADNPNT
jgi:hypothetical protein